MNNGLFNHVFIFQEDGNETEAAEGFWDENFKNHHDSKPFGNFYPTTLLAELDMYSWFLHRFYSFVLICLKSSQDQVLSALIYLLLVINSYMVYPNTRTVLH